MTRNRLARAACASSFWLFALALVACDAADAPESYDPNFPTTSIEATLLGTDDPGAAWTLTITDDATAIVVFERTLSAATGPAKVGLVLNSGRDYTFDALAIGSDGNTIGAGSERVFVPADAIQLQVHIVVDKPQDGGLTAVKTDFSLNNPASFDSIEVSPPEPLPGVPVTLTAIGEDWDGDPFTIAWTLPQQLGGGAATGETLTVQLPDQPGIYEVFCEVTDALGSGTLMSIQLDTAALLFAAIKWEEYEGFNLDDDSADEVTVHTSDKPSRVHIRVDTDNDGAKGDNDDYRGTFTGTITGTSKNGDTVTIQIDQNGDGLPDKTVTVAPDGAGGFTVTES